MYSKFNIILSFALAYVIILIFITPSKSSVAVNFDLSNLVQINPKCKPVVCPPNKECPDPPLDCSSVKRAKTIQRTNTFTTTSGVSVSDATHTQTLGVRGPVLLQDVLLQERLAIQNRERIPERTVHARGTLAKGVFTCTNNQTDLTTMSVFNQTGKTTPIAVRFSTTIHGLGSPEFLRDTRGYAIKFYTDEGNWDLTGINFPVFFLRDPIQFPEMVRSLKPNPVTGVQELWRSLDFFSHIEESINFYTYLFDDDGIPQDYRHMEGHSVHAFIWVNSKKEGTYVRFAWTPQAGSACLLDNAIYANKIYFSCHTIDLYEAIESGQFPKYDLWVQTLPITVTREDLGGVEPLDPTKIWPESITPRVKIGELVLNQWPSNLFNENEQSAFSPGNLVPGILPSDDRLLQARMFAYPDAARYRLGTNFNWIPINRPRCPFLHNNFNNPFVDGVMNLVHYSSQINYYPSNFNSITENPNPELEVANYTIQGSKVRSGPAGAAGEPDAEDNFVQPRERYMSFDSARKTRFAMRWASALTSARMNEAAGQEVARIWLLRLGQISSTLRQNVTNYIASITSSRRDSEFDEFRQSFYGGCGARPGSNSGSSSSHSEETETDE